MACCLGIKSWNCRLFRSLHNRDFHYNLQVPFPTCSNSSTGFSETARVKALIHYSYSSFHYVLLTTNLWQMVVISTLPTQTHLHGRGKRQQANLFLRICWGGNGISQDIETANIIIRERTSIPKLEISWTKRQFGKDHQYPSTIWIQLLNVTTKSPRYRCK